MKDWLKAVLAFIGVVILFVALTYGVGWFGVGYTKTVGKAQKNAEREVYEQTQSYVHAKKQEALKFYKEYQKADPSEKQGIKAMVSHSFAEFDETKLDGFVRSFVEDCKYNP